MITGKEVELLSSIAYFYSCLSNRGKSVFHKFKKLPGKEKKYEVGFFIRRFVMNGGEPKSLNNSL